MDDDQVEAHVSSMREQFGDDALAAARCTLQFICSTDKEDDARTWEQVVHRLSGFTVIG